MTNKSAVFSTAAFCGLLVVPLHSAPGAEPAQKTFEADFGKRLIPPVVLPIKKMPPNQMEGRVFFPVKLSLVSIKAPAKLGPDGEIIIYSNPGKNFRIELTVEFETNEPTKLAANLLMKEAGILPDELQKPLEQNHNSTWHFDTENRAGYESASGKGTMTFDLIGAAPSATGTYSFPMNLGLFRREDWVTEVLYQFKVTLINDPDKFREAEPSTPPDPLALEHVWESSDGRTLKGKFVEAASGSVVIEIAGKRVPIPCAKLGKDSMAQASRLAVAAALAVAGGCDGARSPLASGPPLLPWTNPEGKTLEGEFVKLDGDVLVIRGKGKEFKIPLVKLNEAGASQAKQLAAAAAAASP